LFGICPRRRATPKRDSNPAEQKNESHVAKERPFNKVAGREPPAENDNSHVALSHELDIRYVIPEPWMGG
jgi:hypothetical protein